MPRRTIEIAGPLLSALATILILVLLIGGRPGATASLRDGDLIFQTSQSRQSAAILAATGSNLTHMGIVALHDGAPYVIEAWRTVQETPLADWIARGKKGNYRIYRVEDLTTEQAATVVATARDFLGRPYDPFFRDGTDSIYCSELVRLAFGAAEIFLGEVETVGDLEIDNAAVQAIFAERWQAHPDCSDATDAGECWDRMTMQDIVTPASIAADRQVTLIDGTF